MWNKHILLEMRVQSGSEYRICHRIGEAQKLLNFSAVGGRFMQELLEAELVKVAIFSSVKAIKGSEVSQ